MDEPRGRTARRAGAILACIAVGVAGAWLGMALLARTSVPLGPFRVEIDVGFGRGETRVGLPPFGALTADTHLSPLALRATLEDVGVERLTDIVDRRGIDGLVTEVERDARERVTVVAWRAPAAAGLGGAVLAFLVFRRRWKLVAGGFASAVLIVIASEVLLLETFQVSAFSEPTYSGSLGLAPDLIGPVRETTGRFDDLREGLEQVVDGAVSAYTTLRTTTPLDGDVITVLHISDIHASPLGMDFARQVALGFDVDLVVDTGDLTSFATPVESLIVSKIGSFGRPYVFVRGNHDSIALQAAVAHQPNAVVLDGHAREVAGLRILGLGHPAFTPARGVPVDDEAFLEFVREGAETLEEDLDGLDDPVDLVAVHDDRMTETVVGRVPLVISGHFHETRATVVNGTLLLRIGTTGGSGAGIFRGFDIPFSAEILYFSREEDPKLLAYDVIEQQPDSGNLTVSRIDVRDTYGDLVPTPTSSLSPVPTPTPSASASPSAAPSP
jgi:predicted MPP superfamily phosphohydrolase